MKTPALLLPLLFAASSLSAQTASDAAFAKALNALPKNPCLENRVLDATGFELTVAGKDGSSFNAVFAFDSCYVHDRDSDGDAVTPEAVRHYESKKTGYKLDLRTESGSAVTTVTLLQYISAATFLASGRIGEAPTAKLATGEVRFPKVTLTDFRWHAVTVNGSAVLEPFHGTERLAAMEFTACWTRSEDAEAETFGLPRTFCLYRVGLSERPFDEGRASVKVEGFTLKGDFPLHIVGRTKDFYEVRSVIHRKYVDNGGCSGWKEGTITLGFHVSTSGEMLDREPTVEASLGESHDECHTSPDYRPITYTINHDD